MVQEETIALDVYVPNREHQAAQDKRWCNQKEEMEQSIIIT